jgi:hypothetical protein
MLSAFCDLATETVMEEYGFSISNGQVTGMTRVDGTRTHTVALPSHATFAVATGTVTETLSGRNGTTSIHYAQDAANPAFYDITSEIQTITSPSTATNHGSSGYGFTLVNGAVTAMQAVTVNGSHTHSDTLRVAPATSFSVSGSTVSETGIQGNTVETVQYVQPTGSTLYAVASITDSFVLPGSATTLLSVDPGDRFEFTIGNNGTVTAVQSVSRNGSVDSVRINSHTSFTQVQPGFVQETVTNGSHSSYTLFYAGSGSGGIYTEVAHGSGSGIDLVGLEAQLAQLPTALSAAL